MWTYKVSTGELERDGKRVAIGYSGLEECKNQPDLESVKNRGPLPRGQYRIGPVLDKLPQHPTLHGPILPLAMVSGESYDRSGFLIHGDNGHGTASHGCIILDRTTRLLVAGSGDHDLMVIT